MSLRSWTPFCSFWNLVFTSWCFSIPYSLTVWRHNEYFNHSAPQTYVKAAYPGMAAISVSRLVCTSWCSMRISWTGFLLLFGKLMLGWLRDLRKSTRPDFNEVFFYPYGPPLSRNEKFGCPHFFVIWSILCPRTVRGLGMLLFCLWFTVLLYRSVLAVLALLDTFFMDQWHA